MKVKKVNIKPLWLRKLLISKFGVVLTNWVFQSLLYMNRAEAGFRLGSELALILVLHYFFGFNIFVLIFIVHSIYWTLFGQIFVLLRYLKKTNFSEDMFHNFTLSLTKRVNKRNYIKAVALFGSISKGKLSPTSDLDVRLVSQSGVIPFVRTCLFVFTQRARAFFIGFPLDIYIFNIHDFNTKIAKDEPAIVVKDSVGFFEGFKNGTIEYNNV